MSYLVITSQIIYWGFISNTQNDIFFITLQATKLSIMIKIYIAFNDFQ